MGELGKGNTSEAATSAIPIPLHRPTAPATVQTSIFGLKLYGKKNNMREI